MDAGPCNFRICEIVVQKCVFEYVCCFVVPLFIVLGAKMGPGGPGRCFKSFLEAVPFILTEYEPVASHGHPMAARARKTQTSVDSSI